jgi:NADH-quinone oxidoreductase subunit K
VLSVDSYLVLFLGITSLGISALIMRQYAFLHSFIILEGLGLAVNLWFVALGATNDSIEGELFVLFLVAVAAAEAAVGVSLFLSVTLLSTRLSVFPTKQFVGGKIQKNFLY